MSFTVPITESDVSGLVADLALKAPKASPTLTGVPAAPTAAQGTNTTQLATTAMMHSEATLLAPKASPTFTGTVTVPNGSGATNIAAYGQIPQPGTVGGPAKVVFRTGDSATKSNSTFANDDTLLWAVGANDRWIVQAFLTLTAADNGGSAATADAKFTWSVPASGTMQHGVLGNAGSNFAGYASNTTALSPVALKTATVAVQTMGGDALSWGAALSGYYTGGGTAGNVNLQWAQGTTNVATLLMAKNSLLLLWRIA